MFFWRDDAWTADLGEVAEATTLIAGSRGNITPSPHERRAERSSRPQLHDQTAGGCCARGGRMNCFTGFV